RRVEAGKGRNDRLGGHWSKRRISMSSVANGAHCRRNLRGKKEKGGPSGNRLKGRMLAVPRCSGGLSSGHFWIDGLRLRAATKTPQRRRPWRSRALLVVPSLGCDQPASTDGTGAWGVIHERDLSIKQDKERAESGDAREHARQPKGSPNGHVSKRSNQRPLERLEAENAELRECVAD